MTGMCSSCRTVVVWAQRQVRDDAERNDAASLASRAGKYEAWAEAGAEASRCTSDAYLWTRAFARLAARCYRLAEVVGQEQANLDAFGFYEVRRTAGGEPIGD